MAVAVVILDQRSPERLRAEMRLIERFIGNQIDSDDAYAMGIGRGFQRGTVLRGPREIGRADVPQPPARDPKPPCCQLCQSIPVEHSQRFEEEVCHSLDNSGDGLYLLKLVWPAILKLQWVERMVLELHCRRGLSFEQISIWRGALNPKGLGISDTTAFRVHRGALEAVARAVWTDDGAVNW